MIRRYGAPRQAEMNYRHRPGAYAILARGSEVLLTYQAAPFFEFQLPGGGIDPGESPQQALAREIVEETGWGITRPRRIGAFRRFVYMPELDIQAEKVCHIFLAHPTRPLGPPTEDGHTAIWSPLSDAPSLVSNAGDRAFLATFRAQILKQHR